MKFLTILFAFFLAGATADVTFYNPEKNVTCVGHDSGDITCDPGQQADAQVVSFRSPLPSPYFYHHLFSIS